MNGLWRRAVCVLGLLVGLVAMHGLAPGGAMSVGYPASMAQHTEPRHAVAEVRDASCSDCGQHHARHADASCSAATVGGAPALAGLTADPVPVAVADATAGAYAPGAPDGARAPPSLAELQLLRI